MNLALRNDLPLSTGFTPFDGSIDRLMHSMLEDFFSPYAPVSSGQRQGPQLSVPRINMVENEKAFQVEAELPGVAKEDVKVSINEGKVLIEAEVKRTHEKKDGENVVYSERTMKKFYRSFAVPAEIDEEGAQAKLENGILTLTLPKKEGAKARMIAIE